ncbi:unnamed protein product [Ilex paraguariensis]|uniref:Thioredoxin-like protein YLS8 n=1 Tax=Ilex paraguariensis TaxID=185542 RepID=A0ABC8SY91_9AQUA
MEEGVGDGNLEIDIPKQVHNNCCHMLLGSEDGADGDCLFDEGWLLLELLTVVVIMDRWCVVVIVCVLGVWRLKRRRRRQTIGQDFKSMDQKDMDEVLASVAETIKNFAVIYLVDITEVPDFNTMYELYDPSTVMFFFRNKHIMIDLGTGNNNKINWALKDKQEFIDIIETVYRGARKGRGLVIAPKDYSTKYRY